MQYMQSRSALSWSCSSWVHKKVPVRCYVRRWLSEREENQPSLVRLVSGTRRLLEKRDITMHSLLTSVVTVHNRLHEDTTGDESFVIRFETIGLVLFRNVENGGMCSNVQNPHMQMACRQVAAYGSLTAQILA